MGSNRNEPCPCGSGKKYKKCCLNQLTKDKAVISSELSDALDKPCWYHGTDQSFSTWKLPPPRKPGEDLLVHHTAIFFTINRDFAKEAGTRLARVSLSSNARLLDTIANYAASEHLRREVMRNPMASRTLNVNHDYWHEGWLTGNVLRVAYNDPAMSAHLDKMASDLAAHTGLPFDTAYSVVGHNSARGLIELICVSAKRLGYDALYGHEVDRHSEPGKAIAQPWLAVMSNGVVSSPEWIDV